VRYRSHTKTPPIISDEMSLSDDEGIGYNNSSSNISGRTMRSNDTSDKNSDVHGKKLCIELEDETIKVSTKKFSSIKDISKTSFSHPSTDQHMPFMGRGRVLPSWMTQKESSNGISMRMVDVKSSYNNTQGNNQAQLTS